MLICCCNKSKLLSDCRDCVKYRKERPDITYNVDSWPPSEEVTEEYKALKEMSE